MRITQLQTKILAVTIGLVILLGLTVVAFVQTVLYQRLVVDLEKRGFFIARTAAGECVNPLLAKKFFELDRMVRDLKASEEDIEYLFIVNARGDVVVPTFERAFPAYLKKINSATNGDGNGIERLETEKGIILDFGVPLLQGRAGSVHVGMAESPIKKSVGAITRLLLGIILAVLLVGSGLAVAFAAAITRPMKDLVEAAKAVGSGNLDYKIRTQTSDEIGRLGEAFNVMIEKRKKAESELRASEKKVRDITSQLAEGIYVLDVHGKITFMNPEAERLLGWTLDELNEKGAHNLVHHRRADGTPLPFEACDIHNVIHSGKSFVSVDEVFVKKDGTVFPVSVVSSPIFENGNVVASVTAFRDITSRKEIEQEREQLLLAYEDARHNIKTLKGLMPICASCKRIRDDKGYWNQIESYIQQHSDAEFSHGICPECAKRIYPKYYIDKT